MAGVLASSYSEIHWNTMPFFNIKNWKKKKYSTVFHIF